jgi:hypothetical protein
MLVRNPVAGNLVAVTFRMPPLDGVVELFLCGDFNYWHTSGAPLRQLSDGSWETTLELEAGRSYRYRYYDNQGRWHNDWEADSYVPNDFGSEDSVVSLEGIAVPAPRQVRAAAPKKMASPKKAVGGKPARRPAPRGQEVRKGGGGKKSKHGT